MSNTPMLSASLLSADMACFRKSIRRIEGAVHYLHCDIMDGHFVPNLTYGAPVVKAIKKATSIPLDVHLMIEKPGKWIDCYIDAGLDKNDYLTFHIEAEANPREVLKRIRSAGIKPGIVVKPGTPAAKISGLEELVDQVLVMTVEPGFGGQKFIAEMLDKIRTVRTMFPENVIIAVDGGIDCSTAPMVYNAGATLFIAGSAIFGARRPRDAAEKILGASTNPFGHV